METNDENFVDPVLDLKQIKKMIDASGLELFKVIVDGLKVINDAKCAVKASVSFFLVGLIKQEYGLESIPHAHVDNVIKVIHYLAVEYKFTTVGDKPEIPQEVIPDGLKNDCQVAKIEVEKVEKRFSDATDDQVVSRVEFNLMEQESSIVLYTRQRIQVVVAFPLIKRPRYSFTYFDYIHNKYGTGYRSYWIEIMKRCTFNQNRVLSMVNRTARSTFISLCNDSRKEYNKRYALDLVMQRCSYTLIGSCTTYFFVSAISDHGPKDFRCYIHSKLLCSICTIAEARDHTMAMRTFNCPSISLRGVALIFYVITYFNRYIPNFFDAIKIPGSLWIDESFIFRFIYSYIVARLGRYALSTNLDHRQYEVLMMSLSRASEGWFYSMFNSLRAEDVYKYRYDYRLLRNSMQLWLPDLRENVLVHPRIPRTHVRIDSLGLDQEVAGNISGEVRVMNNTSYELRGNFEMDDDNSELTNEDQILSYLNFRCGLRM